MGARPEQQLALSFLAVVGSLWSQHPGTYKVVETDTDLLPALAQMCIKSLAADVRDGVERHKQDRTMPGELVYRDGRRSELTIRDIVNKIVHGSPERIEVTDGDVRLYFVNNESGQAGWREMWFSGPAFSAALDDVLYKHRHKAPDRERRIADLLDRLGPSQFLPSLGVGATQA